MKRIFPKRHVKDQVDNDSIWKTKNVFRVQLTSLLADKISIAYERIFQGKYSLEIQPAYIFKNQAYHEITQIFFPNYSFQNKGFEIMAGINFIDLSRSFLVPGKRRKHAASKGLLISYRYQHVSHYTFWTGGISGRESGNQDITLSETKNAIGIFYKKRFFRPKKSVSIEKFLVFGFYSVIARKTVFEIYDAYSYKTTYPNKPQITFQFFPVVRAGLAIRLQ